VTSYRGAQYLRAVRRQGRGLEVPGCGRKKWFHTYHGEARASQVTAQAPRSSRAQGSWPQNNASLVKVDGSGPEQVLEEQGDEEKARDQP